ncbi:hypothetical protein BH11MYX3_BH11MYX3_05070 [soil metagenome]
MLLVMIVAASCGNEAKPEPKPTTGSKHAPPPAPKAAPPKPPAPLVKLHGSATAAPYLGCRGEACDGSYTYGNDGKVAVTVVAPPDAEIEINGAFYKAGDAVSIDVVRAALDQPMSSFNPSTRGSVKVRVRVRTAAGLTEPAFELEAAGPLQELFRTVAKGPVAFPVEGAAKFTSDALVESPGNYLHGFKDARVWDVDFISTQIESDRAGSDCHYQSESGQRVAKGRSTKDTTVSVYDRRSGKRVGTRTYRGGFKPCPATMMSNDFIGSAYNTEGLDKYLDSFVHARPSGAEEIPFPADAPVAPVPPPSTVAAGRTLPSFDQVKTRFAKLVTLDTTDGVIEDDHDGMHTLSMYGRSDGAQSKGKQTVILVAVDTPPASEIGSAYFQMTPTSLLHVSVLDPDERAAKKLYEQLVGKSPVQISELLRAQGWNDVYDATPFSDTFNTMRWVVSRGRMSVDITYDEWSAIAAGKVPSSSILVTPTGFLYANTDTLAALTAP